MSEEEKTTRLADEMVRRDLISRDELERVRKRSKSTGVPLYRQLLQLRMIPFGPMEDLLRREFHASSERAEHLALGNELVKMRAITEKQLQEALADQKRSGRLLGSILLEKGIVSRFQVAQALGRQHSMEVAKLDDMTTEVQALEAVPLHVARSYHIIPVRLEGDRLTVLVERPQQRESLTAVGIMLGKRINAILTDANDIDAEIAARYEALKARRDGVIPPVRAAAAGSKPPPSRTAAAKSENKQAQTKQIDKPTKGKKATKAEESAPVSTQTQATQKAPDKANRFEDIAREASGAPVVKLVTTIIQGAINSGATDIHLDPQEPEMRVRYRIDGILHDVMSIPPESQPAVVSRVKIMSDLDITETRRPQDGHISMDVGDAEYDIRVATLPCFLGERVVLRLLDQSSVLAGIKDLGLETEDEDKILRLLQQPYGMILVTGPTGSGKTTSLYAALNQKNVMTDSIVTLEDPVEYQLSGINQVQIDSDIGVSFANTLRAALRQDIDVLLVGEIRDPETAHIAIRAAMTGHLVFSTLHTNDAPEAISTLRNMGVPSYLIASALTAVVAQRLVRRICDKCREPYTPAKTLLKSLRLPETTKKLYRGKGCDLCYHTGNRGRTGIFEVLEVTPEVRRAIAADESPDRIAKAMKLKTMADRCRQKVKDGVIQAEEFLRVIRT